MLYNWLTDVRESKKEISNLYLAVIFGGTTRFGEAIAIVVRYVDNHWSITMADSFQATPEVNDEIVQVVMDTLYREYGLLACMRDRAAENYVTVLFIKVLYHNLLDIVCISHAGPCWG